MIIKDRLVLRNTDNINRYIEDINYIAKEDNIYVEHHLLLGKNVFILISVYNNGEPYKHRRDNERTI